MPVVSLAYMICTSGVVDVVGVDGVDGAGGADADMDTPGSAVLDA
jgi:hypothetical protein